MVGVCVHTNPADGQPTQFARDFKLWWGLTSPRQFRTSERSADRNYARGWQRMERNTLHIYKWCQILASLRSSIITHVEASAPWCSNRTMVNQSKPEGTHYIHRIFARWIHIGAWHRHALQFWCLTFGVEPDSVSCSPALLINHGWRTAAIRWDL